MSKGEEVVEIMGNGESEKKWGAGRGTETFERRGPGSNKWVTERN